MHKKAAYELAIGFALRSLQEEKKVSRERLAKALEIGELAVTRIETGEERMSAGDLVLMLELFGISWDDFYSRVKKSLPAAESAISKG
jgi:transcriptional regulator with XRE-family HTH domain